MKPSAPAFAVAIVFGLGASLPAAPALAQQANPFATAPIRTGSSSIPGVLDVRLAVYDRQSYELSWNRVANAVTYRLAVGSRVVQQSDGLSRYVSGLDISGGFDYTLAALDRSGNALATQRFRVQPADGTQLVAAAGGTGTTPTTPTNSTTGPIRTGVSNLGGNFPVRLAIYDAQSFELFWPRVPGAATYRLSRGGRVVQETNGLSHYVAGIDSSASFAYTLGALDRSGNALRTTSFTVAPRAVTQLVAGTSAPTGPVAPPAGTGSVPAPSNVTAQVYSSTAAELFWEKAPTASRVVRTEVSRGGRLLGSTPGNSFFDATRPAGGTSISYSLVAVSATGARSTPTVFPGTGGTVPTPGADGVPVEVLARVGTAFTFARADGLETMYAVADRVLSRPGSIAGFVELSTADEGGEDGPTTTWKCPAGGTLKTARRTISGPSTSSTLSAADCGFGAIRVSGKFSGFFTGARPFLFIAGQSWDATDYSLRDTRPNGSSVTLANASVQGTFPDDGTSTYRVSAQAYRLSRPGSTSRTDSYVLLQPDPDFRSDGGRPGSTFAFTAFSNFATDGFGVTVTTPFVRDASATVGYASGLLNIAGSGYRYTLESANGDPATFQLDSVTGGGAAVSYTIPWSERFDVGTFDPSTVNLGL